MRTSKSPRAVAAALVLSSLVSTSASASPGASPGDDHGAWVVHQGKKFHSTDPPDRIGEWTAKAVVEWADWSREADYELFLSDDQRFLLVVSGKKRSDEMKLAQKTLERVDEIIRPPGGPPRPKAIPASANPETVHDGDPLGAATMVLVRVEDAEDMASVTAHVASLGNGLDRWAANGAQITSFRLQEPLVAGWLVLPEGFEENEWQPENELTHNLTRLCVLREYGQQPTWLASGIAWFVEEDLHSSIYCMPGRDDFVEVKEHRSWERRLRDLHEDREDPLDVEELTVLSPGVWSTSAALRAWGAARFLALHRPDALPAILADLRDLWETKGVVTREDGSWYRVPGFEVSPEDQRAVLLRHAGPDVFEEMNRFFEKGRTYRP